MANKPLSTALARSTPRALSRAGGAANALAVAGPMLEALGAGFTYFGEKNRLAAETEQLRLQCKTASELARYQHEVRMAELQQLDRHLAGFQQAAENEMQRILGTHELLCRHHAWLCSEDSLQLLTSAQRATELAQVMGTLANLEKSSREVLERAASIVHTLAGSR